VAFAFLMLVIFYIGAIALVDLFPISIRGWSLKRLKQLVARRIKASFAILKKIVRNAYGIGGCGEKRRVGSVNRLHNAMLWRHKVLNPNDFTATKHCAKGLISVHNAFASGLELVCPTFRPKVTPR
jgi:hypothetical protein